MAHAKAVAVSVEARFERDVWMETKGCDLLDIRCEGGRSQG